MDTMTEQDRRRTSLAASLERFLAEFGTIPDMTLPEPPEVSQETRAIVRD